MSRMYRENKRTLNIFVGCDFDCVYCKPSFQAQMKRQKPQANGRGCQKCYDYTPHTHLERLNHAPPRTGKGEFIFMPSSGDPSFMRASDFQKMLDYANKWHDRTFLIQSKDPAYFLNRQWIVPQNVLLGTTIETNLLVFNIPECKPYQYYYVINEAPYPCHRRDAMVSLKHPRKTVTIEPILQFSIDIMVQWMKQVNPEIIWVGYDNHNCRLPEPRLAETEALIERLKAEDFDVRVKSLRKAWYE